MHLQPPTAAGPGPAQPLACAGGGAMGRGQALRTGLLTLGLIFAINQLGCASGPTIGRQHSAGTLRILDAATGRPIPGALLRVVASDPTHPLRVRDILRTPEAQVLTFPAGPDGVLALPSGLFDEDGRVTLQLLAPGYIPRQLDPEALAASTEQLDFRLKPTHSVPNSP